jgi:ligand-binding SRPBCC domain-containing protein
MSEPVTIVQAGPEFELRARQWVPRPLDDVFPFFADPFNLERITPAFLRFHLRRRSTAAVEEGTVLTYTLRLHGIPVLWRSRIEEWQPPHRFVDVQTAGPYARWHHAHDFEEERGGTLLRDTVRYRLHCNPLARTPLLSWVHGDVKRIFEYRQSIIESIFGRADPAGRQ